MLPDFVDEGITLVYNIEPDINVLLDGTATNATSATIYTTPTDRDFFIKQVQLSINKDATATSTFSAITCVVGGVTKTLLRVNTTTLTAVQGLCNVVTLPNGLKVDRGTIIAVTNTTNVANISATGIISGYIID